MHINMCIWVVVKILVPEIDVNVVLVACRFMWQKKTRLTDTYKQMQEFGDACVDS